MRTVNVVIMGNSGVGKASLRGQVCTINWLFIRVRFDANLNNTVRLRPLLDRIPFDHWDQFYHQDPPFTLSQTSR